MKDQSYALFVEQFFKTFPTEIESLLHAGVGISGEAGELLDALKKSWIYNKPLDRDNLREELGDLLFYIQAMANLLYIDFDTLIYLNREKLEKRYPSGSYSDFHAQERLDKK